MGKRELVIAAAFVLVAVVAYQLTAPAPKPGERRFSLTEMFSGIHRGMRANSASASTTKSAAIAVSPAITEIRLTATRAVTLTIVGEKRTDIGYEAAITSTGPDEAAARASAAKAELTSDDLNTALKLDLTFPGEGQKSGELTLRVPNRLLVRIEGSGRVTASDVRALDLRNLSGDVTITNIQERLTGGHRSGELNVTHAGGIELTLVSSRARLSDIAGPITLTARNGDCVIATSKGAIEATVQNVEFTVTDQAGPVRVVGEQGTLRVVAPGKDLAIDVRRMTVEVTLATSIPATIVTTGETLTLSLAGPPGLTLDAIATDKGAIRVTDLPAEPTRQEREARLNASVGGGGPRVVLRNSGGDIVIGVRK
jgi:hypothetical protein